VTLTWAESHAFFKRKVEDPGNREHVVSAIRDVTGTTLRLRCELCDDAEIQAEAPDDPLLSEEELIARFMAEFDAQELPPEPSKES
jgi:DNA polymerase-3 subunit gamma/tau